MEDHSNGRRQKYDFMYVLNVLIDVVIFLFQLILEIFKSFVGLFIGNQLTQLHGDIVLITGAGHGIGRELAIQYTDFGCDVICVDINESGNKETITLANSLNKGTAHAYTCDVTNRDKVMELAAKVRVEVGPVSILVNNAGIMSAHPLEEHTADEIRNIFNVNTGDLSANLLLSSFWAIQAFLPHMKEINRGHIVSMSSVAGLFGLINVVPYCASKFAVRGMMEAINEELRAGPYNNFIKTTVVYPFMVNTGLCKKPYVKYPFIINILDVKTAAASIIDAQRKGLVEASIPRWIFYLNNFCRTLPRRCGEISADFIDTGVESDLI